MAKEIRYKQCFLTKKAGPVTWNQVSYIPEKFAVVGKVLKLRNDAGVWDDGWKVAGANGTSLAESVLPDYHNDIKGHLKTTGDSRRKRKES